MMQYKNRDIIVLRPLGGGNSWTDDQVVVKVLESGEEEVVRKGDIVGYTEDPKSDVVKKGEALVGVAADSTHPSTNAEHAKKQLEDHKKAKEEKVKREKEDVKNLQAPEVQAAPVVKTVPFDKTKK